MEGDEKISSEEVDAFYSASREEYLIPLPDLFERSSGTLQVTYKARVAAGTLSTTTKLTLKCVGPIAGVTPVSPAPNTFVFDEGRTPLEFQIGTGCQADNIVLTVNGNRTVVPITGGTLVARPDTAVTWSAHMEDIIGTEGEISEPETFYMCPRMSFVSHSNQSVAVRTEEEHAVSVELAWPKFEWADAQVCGPAADALGAVKYKLTVKDESGAESVSTVSDRNATLTLLPGTYEVKFEVVVGGTTLKTSEKWSVRVYMPTPAPQEDSDKGGLSKGAVTGIAVGCSVVGAALIVALVLLIIFSVRRYGKKKADEAVAQSQASLQTTVAQPGGSIFLVDPSMVMMDQMSGVPVMVDPTLAVPAPPSPQGSQELSQSSFQQSQQSQQQQANTVSLEQQQQMAMMMMMSQQQQQQQSGFPMTESTMVSPPQ